jgi:DNA-binding FrmR family transcriptional regulator
VNRARTGSAKPLRENREASQVAKTDPSSKTLPSTSAAHLTPATRADIDARLARVEGHVIGIRKMLEGNASCDDLMTQLAAVRAATTQTIAKLFEGHLETCIEESARTGKGEEVLSSLKGTFSTLLRQV